MENVPSLTGGQYVVASEVVAPGRKNAGRWLIQLASLGLVTIVLVQILYEAGTISLGFENWRPVL